MALSENGTGRFYSKENLVFPNRYTVFLCKFMQNSSADIKHILKRLVTWQWLHVTYNGGLILIKQREYVLLDTHLYRSLQTKPWILRCVLVQVQLAVRSVRDRDTWSREEHNQVGPERNMTSHMSVNDRLMTLFASWNLGH